MFGMITDCLTQHKHDRDSLINIFILKLVSGLYVIYLMFNFQFSG
jgi:hypothetical protein